MKRFLVVVFFTLIFCIYNGVQAESITNYITIFPQKTNVDMNKEWRVQFNNPIDLSSVNSTNFKVLDNYTDIGAKIKADKINSKVVIIEFPTLGYVPGKTYTLNISQNVKSQDGKALSKPIQMQFTTTSTMVDGTNYINLPIISSFDILNKNITPTDSLLLSIKSSNASNVKYRVYLYKFNNMSYKFDFYRELTLGYTNEINTTNAYNFQYNSGVDTGEYKVVVYVKKADKILGEHEDGNTDFDNYYTNYFRCVQNVITNSTNQTVILRNYNISFDKIADEQYASSSSQYEIGSNWNYASKNIISYYMNYNNFMDNIGKYMFMRIDQTLNNITADDLNLVLKGKGTFEGMGQAFIDASNQYKVNVAYLVSHALEESNQGKSNLSSGNIIINGKSTYNFWGIHAYDSDPDNLGSQYAYENGWFTPKDAIFGGTKFIAQQYIYNTSSIFSDRKTLYNMKWNPSYPASYQYATDVAWAYNNAEYMYRLFNQFLDNNNVIYEIPSFN